MKGLSVLSLNKTSGDILAVFIALKNSSGIVFSFFLPKFYLIRLVKGGVLMYEDEWREYYANKEESIHITSDKLIFQCKEGIALFTHKTEVEIFMHALALKLLLIDPNSYDFYLYSGLESFIQKRH